jgi:hypothetical protein
MSRSSQVLHAGGFTPLKATIVPIGSEGMSAFGSETAPVVVPQARADQVDKTSTPPSLKVTLSASNKRQLLLWLGIVIPAIAGGAVSGLTLASFGASAAPLPAMGAVTITSEPSGAPVTVDGESRGSTPLVLAVSAGSHRLEVGKGAEASPHLLQVSQGGNTAMHVQWRMTPASSPTPIDPGPAGKVNQIKPPAAPVNAERPRLAEHANGSVGVTSTFRPVATGWLIVASTFPVQILDNGTEVGSSESSRIALPAGDHELSFVNTALDFREARKVTIVAGKKASLTVETPRGTLHANARPWAEVWIDGRRVGETPIANIALPIGEHEVTFRHPKYGEQRKTVTVGARSATRVAVEFQP